MKKIACLLIFLFSLSCGKEKHDQRIVSIDKFMQGQVEFFKFNGNILMAEKGKVIYQKSFGMADFNIKRPLNDSCVFELASVSKQFTAMGILTLEKQGKLDLNDSLRKYFPELPYTNITIHHLLTHTSGLPDYGEIMESKWNHQEIAFNNDMIDCLAKEKPPVHFESGTKWEYCNTAYAILASIIEKVSGLTFKDFMAKFLFEPLQMNHSRVYNTRRSGENIENYAFGFVWSDSLNRFILPDSLPEYDYVYYLDGIQGDGIINSTTGDLLKWDRFMADQTLHGDTMLKKILFPYVLCDSTFNAIFSNYFVTSMIHYGYGVFIGENHFGKFVSHSGGWPGYITELVRYIDNDITIIILSNNESHAPSVQRALTNILFKQPIEYPRQHDAITLDTTSLNMFVGTFLVRHRKFDIVRENDSLFQIFATGYRSNFLPESNSKVFSPENNIQFEIVKDSSDQLKYYRIFYGIKEEMEKLK